MTDHEHFLDPAEGPDWTRLARDIAEGRVDVPHGGEAGERRASLMSALATVLHAPDPSPPSDDDVERALHAVLARRLDGAIASLILPSRRRPRQRAAWSAAAAVVIAAGALIVSRRGETTTGVLRPQTVATRVGQVDSLRLPDGSLVVLGPASSIERAAEFGASAREVTLHGDAFFDVVHDAAHPFVVRTSRGVLRDVGTSFVVRSDAPEGLMVSVRTGVVALLRTGAETDAETRLSAGDRATVPAHGDVAIERGTSRESDAAFTRGRLVLENASVAEIVDAMHRWYGLEFRVVDPALLGRRVTATFERESGPDAARIVAAVMGGSVRLSGDSVLVSSGATGSPPR